MTTVDDALAYRREERAAAPQDGGAELVIRPDATPGFDAFQKACEDREFKRTWDHKRADLADQSTATYDLELARLALRSGWNDQQTVDLLIWHRATQIEPPEDALYYAALLTEARSSTVPDGAEKAGGSDVASTLLPILNRELGIQIERIVKYGANGGTFELRLASGHKVDLGTTEDVLNQRRVKARIADATAEVIPGFGSVRWDKIARGIFRCAGLAPIEETPEQQEMAWLVRSRLADTTVTDVDEGDRAGLAKIIRHEQVSGGWAFRDTEKRLMLHLGGLLASIRLKHGVLLSYREGGKRLRKMGFIPRDLEGKADEKGKPRINVWAAPRGWE
jgi:hypothetical protein